MSKSIFPALPLLAVGAIGFWVATRRRGEPPNKKRLLPVIEGPHPSDPAVSPQDPVDPGDPDPDPAPIEPDGPPLPGRMYGGKNPGPWDDLGVSLQHEEVDGWEELDSDSAWAVYRHMNGSTLFGASKWETFSGFGSAVFKGPFDSADDAIQTVRDHWNLKMAGNA